MKSYKKSELENKSRYELSNIIVKENLSEYYNIDNSREAMLKLILSNRSQNNLKRIMEYDEKSFLIIQDIIDKDLIISENYNDFIIHNEIFIIYLNLDNSDNYIKIHKDCKISKDILLLINSKKYIYGFLYLEYVESENNYLKYKIIFPKEMNRMFKTFMNENLYFLFLEEASDEIIYMAYNHNFNNKYINNSIYSYIYKIEKFEINIAENIDEKLYINIENNKLETIYHTEEFYVVLLRNKPTLNYLFGNEAKKYILDRDFSLNETYFIDLYNFIENMDKIEYGIDFYNISNILDKKILLEKYIIWFKNKIENKIKKIFNEIIILSDNKNIKKLDFNIEKKLKYINFKYINFEKNIDRFLLFNFDNNNFSIIDNKTMIIDNKVNYNINIESEILLFNENRELKSIIEYLIKYVKLSIYCFLEEIDLESLFVYNQNFIYYLKSTEINIIEKSIDEKLNKIEYIFNSDYEKYKKNIKKFNDAEKNYNYIKYIASNLLDYYLKNPSHVYYRISDILENDTSKIRNTFFSKAHIEEIIKFVFYNTINTYFINNELLDILKKYKGIRLNGSILKTDSFIEVIKEFIPGKLLSFNNNEEINFLKKSIYFDKLILNGDIVLDFKLKDINYNLILYYVDYKENKIKIITNNENYSYIDKNINLIKMDFEIEISNKYINSKLINFDINFKEEYFEMDENEFIILSNKGIKSEDLNEITNSIIRLFFYFEKNLLCGYFVKRINDQIYYYKYQKSLEI